MMSSKFPPYSGLLADGLSPFVSGRSKRGHPNESPSSATAAPPPSHMAPKTKTRERRLAPIPSSWRVHKMTVKIRCGGTVKNIVASSISIPPDPNTDKKLEANDHSIRLFPPYPDLQSPSGVTNQHNVETIEVPNFDHTGHSTSCPRAHQPSFRQASFCPVAPISYQSYQDASLDDNFSCTPGQHWTQHPSYPYHPPAPHSASYYPPNYYTPPSFPYSTVRFGSPTSMPGTLRNEDPGFNPYPSNKHGYSGVEYAQDMAYWSSSTPSTSNSSATPPGRHFDPAVDYSADAFYDF